MPTRQTAHTHSADFNSAASSVNQTKSLPVKNSMRHEQCDVLVIGAGLAGLSTALSLPSHLNIVILAKEDLQACSSHYAQGGIAAVIDSNDCVAEHVSDTLIAGDGLCDVSATTQILAQGADAIDWLLRHDVPFTTNGDGDNIESDLSKNATLAELHLTKEGGHGRRRVAHADDATGKHIMQALHQQALAATHIDVRPYHEALRLLTDNQRCTGAQVIDTQNNVLIEFDSQAVVIASGGLGKLFSRATAPDVCVGDGIMMAWEAGCRLANLEFIQFHPTGLVHSDSEGNQSNFLISEAVRGEGGLLRCPLTHERFMPNYDPREELAPRDIVARAIANEISKNKLGYVHLDISHKPAAFVQEHFPVIYAHCLELGIDITKAPIPVAPTAHYTCGGVVTTAEGKTDIKGLYAAGEVANTGLHGANRLASNSLLECVVVGREIAQHLPRYLNDNNDWNCFGELATIEQAAIHTNINVNISEPDAVAAHAQFEVPLTDLLSQNSHLLANSDLDVISDISTIKQLKTLMTNKMGIRRSADQLKEALNQVLAYKNQQRSITALSDTDFDLDNFDLDNFRWQRLLTLASLLLQSALTREESRGGHSRNDFPALSDIPAISVVRPIDSADNSSESQTVDNPILNETVAVQPVIQPAKQTKAQLAQTA